MSGERVSRCVVVAEVGINHNGDIDLAKRMIDMAAFGGCDFVKFQKRTIDLVYTEEELDKLRDSPWGTTNRDQKMGLEFGKKEYDEIDNFCSAKRIRWFASPWDPESVKFLVRYNIPYLKVASASVTDLGLLEEIKSTSVPVIMSTGMSMRGEVRKAADFLGDQLEYLLACTSTYPTNEREMNVNFVKTLRAEYPNKKIGFSNHHPGILYPVAAAVLGARMIEFHITLDRAMYGSDQAASIELPGIWKILDYVRSLEKGLGSGEWIVQESEEAIKKKLRRTEKFEGLPSL